MMTVTADVKDTSKQLISDTNSTTKKKNEMEQAAFVKIVTVFFDVSRPSVALS